MIAKSEKSGLKYDDLGFLIGMRRVERSTTQIEKDVSDVLSLLKGARTPLNNPLLPMVLMCSACIACRTCYGARYRVGGCIV